MVAPFGWLMVTRLNKTSRIFSLWQSETILTILSLRKLSHHIMPHTTYGYVVPSLLILLLQLCCLVLCTGVGVGTCLSLDYRPNLEPTTQILRDCCRPQSKQQSSPDNNCCLDKPIVIQTDTSVVTLPSMQILVLTPLIPAAIHWDITPYPLLTLYLLSAILSRAPPITYCS